MEISLPPILDDENNKIKNTICGVLCECFLRSKKVAVFHTENIHIEIVPKLTHTHIIERTEILYNQLCLAPINEVVFFGDLVIDYCSYLSKQS